MMALHTFAPDNVPILLEVTFGRLEFTERQTVEGDQLVFYSRCRHYDRLGRIKYDVETETMRITLNGLDPVTLKPKRRWWQWP